MNKIKCFDVASEIIEEATKQFSPVWKLNNDNYKIFEKYCNTIDKIIESISAISFGVSVDDISMFVTLSVECVTINSESNNDYLSKLIKAASKVKFEATKDGDLMISFVFPPLWDHI